jgi:hypothetical protein
MYVCFSICLSIYSWIPSPNPLQLDADKDEAGMTGKKSTDTLQAV